MTFCVYVTIYKGGKLPPFYIGSSSRDRILNGYCGSVSSKTYKKIWQYELKTNPHLFVTRILCCFQNRQEALNRENYIQRQLNVVDNCLYINQAYAIPDGCFGKSFRGKSNPMFGKTREDAKQRMLKNNPMFNSDTAKRVAVSKKRLRRLGRHKTTRNHKHTLQISSQRMKANNPSDIRCCCCICRTETTPSALTRFHKKCKE